MPNLLVPAEDGAAVVACSTCRASTDAKDDAEGMRGGARLVAALQAVQASDPRYAGIAVQAMPCLFACQDFCTIHVRGPAKIGYVLGRFTPDEDAARAILDYAVLHAESAEGQVPFRQWPAGIKGHFITRTPPAGYVAQ
jgi:predicted metal-binding protein